MTREWTAEEILALGRSFQPVCVVAAAADLDLFAAIGDGAIGAEEAAGRVGGSLRGTTILLDALAALGFLARQDGRYSVPASLRKLLRPGHVALEAVAEAAGEVDEPAGEVAVDTLQVDDHRLVTLEAVGDLLHVVEAGRRHDVGLRRRRQRTDHPALLGLGRRRVDHPDATVALFPVLAATRRDRADRRA